MKKYRGHNYWLNKVYHQQRYSSIKRGHPEPDYTKQELEEWIVSNHAELFIKLYSAWEAADYPKHLVPSLDRLDDSKPYTLCNLQLVTWQENERNYKNNRNANQRNICIEQVCLETGNVIDTYLSGSLAAEELRLNTTSINRAARGERKSYAGFHWRVQGIPWEYKRKQNDK